MKITTTIANTNLKIAIASGKGGTGKTFISTNLFNTLRDAGYSVTLVDCDAEAPNDRLFLSGILSQTKTVVQKVPVVNTNRCTFCGACFDYCNYNAIFFLAAQKMLHILEDQCHGCDACLVACTNGALSEKDVPLGTVSHYTLSENVTLIEARMNVGIHSPVPLIKAAIKAAGKNNLLLLDSPPGTSCSFIQTVNEADYVVLVTEPTPFGLSDLVQSVETLKSIGKNYGVIVNRAGLGDNELYTYLETENIPLLMEIPFDRLIASTYSKGTLISQLSDEWAVKFSQLYQSIIEHHGNSHHQR
jgi:MinD superfamily P-loop ATPase